MSGAIGGKISDDGIDDQFMIDLGDQVQPEMSAIFPHVLESTPDPVLGEVKQYGGSVLNTSLSMDAEDHRQQALQQRQAPTVHQNAAQQALSDTASPCEGAS